SDPTAFLPCYTALHGPPSFPTRRSSDLVRLLPVDAGPACFGGAVADAAERPAGGREAAAAHFTRERMAGRYARIYPRAVEAARRSEEHTSELQSPCSNLGRLLPEKQLIT